MRSPSRPVRWYSSFYWRIGISFVVSVIVVLVAQGLMVGYARSNGAFAAGNPTATAAAIAAEAGHALPNDPTFDISTLLSRERPALSRTAYVVMSDGRLVSRTNEPLRSSIERQIRAMLAGVAPVAAAGEMPTGPVVAAPIQAAGRLVGMVVLPPPPPRGLLANVGELLSLPGTIALVVITALAALVIGVLMLDPAVRMARHTLTPSRPGSITSSRITSARRLVPRDMATLSLEAARGKRDRPHRAANRPLRTVPVVSAFRHTSQGRLKPATTIVVSAFRRTDSRRVTQRVIASAPWARRQLDARF